MSGSNRCREGPWRRAPESCETGLGQSNFVVLFGIGTQDFGIQIRCLWLTEFLVRTGGADQRVGSQVSIISGLLGCLPVQPDRFRQIAGGVFLNEGALVQVQGSWGTCGCHRK